MMLPFNRREVVRGLSSSLAISSAPRPLLAARQRRLALTIGNNLYNPPHGRLFNCANDAIQVAKRFATIGFSKVLSYKDVNEHHFRLIVEQFARTIQEYKPDVVAFYYSGHGGQDSQGSVFFATDTGLTIPSFGKEFLKLNYLVESVIDANRQNGCVALIFLDACRSSGTSLQVGRNGKKGPPFEIDSSPQQPRQESLSTRGWHRIAIKTDFMVCYATAPNSTATDQGFGSSPYAAALEKYLGLPGMSMAESVSRIHRHVLTVTKGEQITLADTGLSESLFLVPR